MAGSARQDPKSHEELGSLDYSVALKALRRYQPSVEPRRPHLLAAAPLAHSSSISGILGIGYRDSNGNFRGSGAQSGPAGCYPMFAGNDPKKRTWETMGDDGIHG
jgi:hypothetical protein